MAKQKFSAIEREAIWIAHEKKCAYSRELIDVTSFHIDHVLPESLSSKPEEFTRIKAKFGLDEDFDLCGLCNLLPCKSGMNLQKSATVLNESAVHFYLDLAARKSSEIQSNIQKIQNRIDRGKAIIFLQQLVENGKISPIDFAQTLEQCSESCGGTFNLLSGMDFIEKCDVRVVCKSDIDELMNLPVKFGRNDHITSIPMINNCDQKIEVRTCNEYIRAIKEGFYVCGGLFIKISAWLEHYAGLLLSLKAATLPNLSFVSDPKIGVADLQLIPASVFPFMEGPEIDLRNKSYQDLVNDGVVSVKRVGSNLLQVESETMGQTLIEAVRADFNNDGIEDILLFEYCFATKGTLGYGNVLMLTRKSCDSTFEVVTPKLCDYEHVADALSSRA